MKRIQNKGYYLEIERLFQLEIEKQIVEAEAIIKMEEVKAEEDLMLAKIKAENGQ